MKNKKYLAFVVVLTCTFLCLADLSFAQQWERHPLLDKAIDSLKVQEWEEMTKALEVVVKEEPENKFAWGLLGYSLHSANRYDEAIAMFEKALSFSKDPFNAYNIAAAYSLKNEKDKAFEWLSEAIEFGYQDEKHIKIDTDLDNLRNDKRFAFTLNHLKKKANPCEFDKTRHEFDFWLGEWTAFDKQGQRLGTIKIESIEKGCAISEKWNSMFGDSANILNFYNSKINKWERIKINNAGDVTTLVGEIAGKVMKFKEINTANAGNNINDLIEFYLLPDNTVRQIWKTSRDNGKSLQTVHEIIYVKKN